MDTKIDRYDVITIVSAEKNPYGDLIVNGELKVGIKRANIFNVFQVGAEVKLGYASYMNKEYIATAEQTGKHSSVVQAAVKEGAVPITPPVEPVQPVQDAPQPKSTPVKPQSSIMTPSGQEVGMTTKEIGDMIRSKMLSIIFGEEIAKKLVEWYKTRIQTTTGIK